MSKSPLLFHFGHLIFYQLVDFVDINFLITPKSHFSNVTFRRPNCSYALKAITS